MRGKYMQGSSKHRDCSPDYKWFFQIQVTDKVEIRDLNKEGRLPICRSERLIPS